MIAVSLKNIDMNRTIEIVHELKDSGLVQGVDFDFSYHLSEYDGWEEVVARHSKFMFYTEKYAVWFMLKWQ